LNTYGCGLARLAEVPPTHLRVRVSDDRALARLVVEVVEAGVPDRLAEHLQGLASGRRIAKADQLGLWMP
jgi:hypothetical protein